MKYTTKIREGAHGVVIDGDIPSEYILKRALAYVEELPVGQQMKIESQLKNFDPEGGNGREWVAVSDKKGVVADMTITNHEDIVPLLAYLIFSVESDNEKH